MLKPGVCSVATSGLSPLPMRCLLPSHHSHPLVCAGSAGLRLGGEDRVDPALLAADAEQPPPRRRRNTDHGQPGNKSEKEAKKSGGRAQRGKDEKADKGSRRSSRKSAPALLDDRRGSEGKPPSRRSAGAAGRDEWQDPTPTLSAGKKSSSKSKSKR